MAGLMVDAMCGGAGASKGRCCKIYGHNVSRVSQMALESVAFGAEQQMKK